MVTIIFTHEKKKERDVIRQKKLLHVEKYKAQEQHHFKFGFTFPRHFRIFVCIIKVVKLKGIQLFMEKNNQKY